MKKFLPALVLGLLLSLSVAAQPDWMSQAERVRDHAYKSPYAYDLLQRLCHQVGPRLSGSPGAAAGVEFLRKEMESLGLQVWLQPCKVPHWVRGEERGELLDYPGKPPGVRAPLALTTLGGSSSTGPAGLQAEVLVVDSFARLQKLGDEQIAGKIVLFNHPFDEALAAQGQGGEAYGQAVGYRVEGPRAASQRGALACLVRSVGGANYRLPHTGSTVFGEARPIPAAAVAAEDADRIEYLTGLGPVKLNLLLTPETLPDADSFNVIGDLPGTDPEGEIVIVSGHLDSWDVGTGALDDASGVVTAMQAAHTLRKLGLRPRRTLRVIGWMNEENGTRGSRTYDAETLGHKHFAACESDLGCGHCVGIACWAPDPWLKALAPLSVVLQPLGAGSLRASQSTRADIYPLQARGLACFAPIFDSRPYFHHHHTGADTVDKVDPLHLSQNAAVVSVLAWALSNLDRP